MTNSSPQTGPNTIPLPSQPTPSPSATPVPQTEAEKKIAADKLAAQNGNVKA